jgi:hypothetical protein
VAIAAIAAITAVAVFMSGCTAGSSASPASPASPASIAQPTPTPSSAAPASSATPGASSAAPDGSPAAPDGSPAAPAPTDRSHRPLPPRASLEPPGNPTTGEVPVAVIGRARDLLAATIGADAAASATVEVAEAVTWPDGSIGCPQPGFFYTQMVTPGYRLVLASGGTRYTFVGSVAGELRACERPRPGG